MSSSTFNKLIRAAKTGYIIVSLTMCILGIVMVLKPQTSTIVICYVAGGLLIIFGIVKIFGYLSKDLYRLAFQYDLAFGILLITLGIIMVCRPRGILTLFYSVVGILLLSDGLFKIQLSIDSKSFGISKWWLILLFAVLTGFFGVMLILRPIKGATAVAMLLGLALLAEGFMNLCVSLCAVNISPVSRMDSMDIIDSDIIDSDTIDE